MTPLEGNADTLVSWKDTMKTQLTSPYHGKRPEEWWAEESTEGSYLQYNAMELVPLTFSGFFICDRQEMAYMQL